MFPFAKIRYKMLNLVLVVGLFMAGMSWGAVPALAESDQAGAVYTLSNAPGGNAVVVFDRADDGTLTPAGTFFTGGTGSGSGLGSQGSVTLSRDGRWLFAVNAGSNDISSFKVRPDGLSLVSRVASGGTMPVSITSHHDLVYVLNAGGSGNIAGFKLGNDGSLTPIASSARPLSGSGVMPAEIEFSPRGGVLVVTEKGTSKIDTYTVGNDGLASGPMVYPSNGATPFGFDFSQRGDLFVTEAPASAVSSYAVGGDGSVKSISASVPDFQSAACWLVVTNNSRLAFAANAHNDTISSYRIGSDGKLTLAVSLAAALPANSAPIDLGLSRGSQYLYQLTGAGHTITGFRVHADGSLTQAGRPVAAGPMAVGLAAR